MTIASICRSLHVLPRSGGVLDQPANEMLKLDKVLEAFVEWEKIPARKRDARNRLNDRGSYRGIDQ